MLAIERLAKQMNWKKFSLMGHSMGAGMQHKIILL
jgi:uncharacterized alpha/beta hydrolase family protein